MKKATYSEKEILGDGLAAAKFSTDNYNTFSNECSHEQVRSTMMKILNEEHDIQNDVFKLMSEKGYYPTPAADQSKVSEAKKKYESGMIAGMGMM